MSDSPPPPDVRFVRELMETNRRLTEKVRQLVAVVRFYEKRNADAAAAKEAADLAEEAIADAAAADKDRLLADVDAFL